MAIDIKNPIGKLRVNSDGTRPPVFANNISKKSEEKPIKWQKSETVSNL
jgi:hypothetical protein